MAADEENSRKYYQSGMVGEGMRKEERRDEKILGNIMEGYP